MQIQQNLVVPAKAGIHTELIRANSLWIPAFAGTTEGDVPALSTKHSIVFGQNRPKCKD